MNVTLFHGAVWNIPVISWYLSPMQKHKIEDQLSVVVGIVNEQRELLTQLREKFQELIEEYKKQILELGNEADRMVKAIDKKVDSEEYPNAFSLAVQECKLEPILTDEELEEALYDESDELEAFDINESVEEIIDFAKNA